MCVCVCITDCPLACFSPCFLEKIFLSMVFHHQWFLSFLYGKQEPGKAQYQQNFEMSRQSSCCGNRALGIILQKLARSVLFSV